MANDNPFLIAEERFTRDHHGCFWSGPLSAPRFFLIPLRTHPVVRPNSIAGSSECPLNMPYNHVLLRIPRADPNLLNLLLNNTRSTHGLPVFYGGAETYVNDYLLQL